MQFLFCLSTTYQHGLHPQNGSLLDTDKTEDRERESDMSGGRSVGWSVSHPDNPARGVSLSQLSGVHCAEQTPSGQLECY